jgi:hypothetical protein
MDVWYRIIAAFCPGVTATDAFDGEPGAFEGAVGVYGGEAVLGAGRVEAAAGEKQGGDEEAIAAHEAEEEEF